MMTLLSCGQRDGATLVTTASRRAHRDSIIDRDVFARDVSRCRVGSLRGEVFKKHVEHVRLWISTLDMSREMHKGSNNMTDTYDEAVFKARQVMQVRTILGDPRWLDSLFPRYVGSSNAAQ